MRKIIALVVALTMILSITAVSASACFTNTTARTNRAASNLAAPKMTSLIPTLDFASILANVQRVSRAQVLFTVVTIRLK